MRVPHFSRRTRLRPLIGFMLLAGVQTAALAQGEFASFRITGVDGYIGASGQRDSTVTTAAPSLGGGAQAEVKQSQSDLRIEAALNVHSFIVHPKFIELDVGLGVSKATGKSQVGTLDSTTRETFTDVSVHARILQDKPIRGSAFYEDLNTTPTIDSVEVFKQRNERMGFGVTVMSPPNPYPLNLGVTRSHETGNSSLRVVDDLREEVTMTGGTKVSNFGTSQLRYQGLRQTSNSGTLSAPIINSVLHSNNLALDTHLNLGSSSPYQIDNHIEYNQQRYQLSQGQTPDLQDLRFLLNYHGRPTKDLLTFANYQYADSKLDNRSTKVNSVDGGAGWEITSNLGLGGSAHLSDTRATEMQLRNWGIEGSARYSHPLPVGVFSASYSLRFDQLEQNATSPTTNVVGEGITLNVLLPVPLARQRVTPGSVVVTNSTRTQTYVDGVDYTVSVIGTSTRIQRILSGSIVNGQQVLVDYNYDNGGTYAATQTDQNVGLNWAITRQVNAYFRYGTSTPKVTSGNPNYALNAIQTTIYGIRADIPLGQAYDFTVGGSLEREIRQETYSPYTRTAMDAYVQGDFSYNTGATYRVGARRSQTVGDSGLSSYEQTGYDLTLGWQIGAGLYLSALGVHETDTSGGFEPRQRDSGTLRAQWRYRRLSVSANLSRIRESQGLYTRDRTVGQVYLRRDL